MNILKIIIDNETSERVKNHLEKIYEFSEICLILEKYYREILVLKPVKKNQAIDKEKLKEIILSTNHSIIPELNLVRNLAVWFITYEILCRIRLKHFEEFGNGGAALEKLQNEIAISSCNNTYPCENEFICMFLKKINNKTLERRDYVSLLKNRGFTFLLWNGTEKQLIELEWRLNNTDWFTQPVVVRKLFSSKNTEPDMHCRSKRLTNLAVLFRLLNNANLIEANVGKSFMQIASRHIFCADVQVTAHKLNKLSSEILTKPELNLRLIESISKIIEAVLKA
jgi:hypothetical protein